MFAPIIYFLVTCCIPFNKLTPMESQENAAAAALQGNDESSTTSSSLSLPSDVAVFWSAHFDWADDISSSEADSNQLSEDSEDGSDSEDESNDSVTDGKQEGGTLPSEFHQMGVFTAMDVDPLNRRAAKSLQQSDSSSESSHEPSDIPRFIRARVVYQEESPVGETPDFPDDDADSLMGQVVDTLAHAKNWDCVLPFDISEDNDTESNVVDLLDYLAPVTAQDPPKDSNGVPIFDYPAKTRLMFPSSKYRGMTALDSLTSALKLSALKAGFNLTKRNSIKDSSVIRGFDLLLRCTRGRLFEPSRFKSKKPPGQKKTYKTRPHRPLEESELCDFKLSVFMLNSSHHRYPECWFLSAASKGVDSSSLRRHKAHLKLPGYDLHKSLDLLTAEEYQQAQDMDYLNLTSTQQSEFINLRDGNNLRFSPRQFSYLRMRTKTLEEAMHGIDSSMTSAEKLMEKIKLRDDVSWLCVTFSMQDGLLLTKRLSSTTSTEEAVEVEENITDSCEEAVVDEAKKLHHENSLADNQKLLLVFMMAHDEEVRLFTMHPEIIAIDCVGRLSKEKRDWLTVAGLDGNNKAFNVCRSVIPSGQKWVFHLCFTHCMPALFGDLLKLVFIGLTDGDRQEIDGFVSSIQRGIFPNAVNRLCYYHHFIQKWTKEVVCFVPPNDPVARSLAGWVWIWIKSWYFTLETEAEFLHSRKCLFEWLENHKAQLSPIFVEKANLFIEKKYKSDDIRVLQWRFHTVVSMDHRTTNCDEVTHHSARTGVHAVDSSKAMDDTGTSMMNKVLHKSRKSSALNAFQMLTSNKWSNSNCADWLTDDQERKSAKLDQNTHHLRGIQVSDEEWLVFLPNGGKAEDMLLAADTSTQAVQDSETVIATQENTSVTPITRFFRVRRVRLIDGAYLHCDCEYPRRNKKPCIHIIFVVGFRHPIMYGLRWSICFQYYYQKKHTCDISNELADELTPVFNRWLDRENKRLPEQSVYVKPIVNRLPKQEEYPYLYPGTSAEDAEFCRKLCICKEQNLVVERARDGRALWPSGVDLRSEEERAASATMAEQAELEDDWHFDNLWGDDDDLPEEGQYPAVATLDNPRMESQVSITERAQRIIDERTRLTQEEQFAAHNPLGLGNPDSRYHHAQSLFTDIYTKMCKNEEEERAFILLMEEFKRKLTLKRREESGEDQIDRPATLLPAVADSTQPHEQRKKQAYEKNKKRRR